MIRKITALGLVMALTSIIGSPVQAKTTPTKPAQHTYYLNWAGDCAGGGYLAPRSIPNEEGSCALFFPGISPTSHSFPLKGNKAFILDATKTIPVDFSLFHLASAAADFTVTVEATIGGETVPVASGLQTVVAATVLPDNTFHHVDLEPDASLHGKKVTGLNVTVAWTNGATFSELWLEDGATIGINALQ